MYSSHERIRKYVQLIFCVVTLLKHLLSMELWRVGLYKNSNMLDCAAGLGSRHQDFHEAVKTG
jgi:hypothetical protein